MRQQWHRPPKTHKVGRFSTVPERYSTSWGNIRRQNHDSEFRVFKTLRKLWMSEKFVWFRKIVEDVEVPDMLENVEIAH